MANEYTPQQKVKKIGYHGHNSQHELNKSKSFCLCEQGI